MVLPLVQFLVCVASYLLLTVYKLWMRTVTDGLHYFLSLGFIMKLFLFVILQLPVSHNAADWWGPDSCSGPSKVSLTLQVSTLHIMQVLIYIWIKHLYYKHWFSRVSFMKKCQTYKWNSNDHIFCIGRSSWSCVIYWIARISCLQYSFQFY